MTDQRIEERRAFSVAGVLPFWRYAVAIVERADLPAIPFFRRASAAAFADETQQQFPERTVVILRRVFGAVEVIRG